LEESARPLLTSSLDNHEKNFFSFVKNLELSGFLGLVITISFPLLSESLNELLQFVIMPFFPEENSLP
jgi:hypothetical protein